MISNFWIIITVLIVFVVVFGLVMLKKGRPLIGGLVLTTAVPTFTYIIVQYLLVHPNG